MPERTASGRVIRIKQNIFSISLKLMKKKKEIIAV